MQNKILTEHMNLLSCCKAIAGRRVEETILKVFLFEKISAYKALCKNLLEPEKFRFFLCCKTAFGFSPVTNNKTAR